MKKKAPLYTLVKSLNLHEIKYIEKYIGKRSKSENEKSYLHFFKVLVKTENLQDCTVLKKLKKNNISKHFSAAKYYLNKQIIFALIDFNLKNSESRSEINSDYGKYFEVRILFDKGLYDLAEKRCKIYIKFWHEQNNNSMLSMAYHILESIEINNPKKGVDLEAAKKSIFYLEQDLIEKKNRFLLNEYTAYLNKNGFAHTKKIKKYYKSCIKKAKLINKNKPNKTYFFLRAKYFFGLMKFSKSLKQCGKCFDILIKEQISKHNVIAFCGICTFAMKAALFSNELESFLHYKQQLETEYNKYPEMQKSELGVFKHVLVIYELSYQSKLGNNQFVIDEIEKIKLNSDSNFYKVLQLQHFSTFIKMQDYEKALQVFLPIMNQLKSYPYPRYYKSFCFFYLWMLRYEVKDHLLLISVANRYGKFLRKFKEVSKVEKELLKFMQTANKNWQVKHIEKRAALLLKTLNDLIDRKVFQPSLTENLVLNWLKSFAEKRKMQDEVEIVG